MDNKLNDIYENLNQEVDLSCLGEIKSLKLDKKKKSSTNDLFNDLPVKLKPLKQKLVKLNKNKTKNFDSVIKEKKLKNIDLSVKPSIFKIVLWWIKWKLTLTGQPIWFFKNRKYITRWFFKKMWVILLWIFVLLYIDKLIIVNKTESWYEKILSIKNYSWDIEKTKKIINDAKLDFIIADILFKPFLLIPNKEIQNGYYVINWWKNISKLLDKSIQTYFETEIFVDSNWWIENIDLTNLLKNLEPSLIQINDLLYKTIVNYENIGDLWDKNLNNKLLFAKEKLKYTYNLITTLTRDYEEFLSILWHNWEKKYLILFQNNDEIRATGWFIWSLATLTLSHWKIDSFVTDDVYAYEWDINKVYTDKKPAPEWLNKITSTFWLRDANYFIDFDESSNSIKYFLDMINKDIDWILYINQDTILDFLNYTWSIDFEKIEKWINSENFSLVISTLVEAQSFKVWTLSSPKQVLFDFAYKFIDKLKQDKDYFKYLDIVIKNIESRDIVFYSFNPEENNLLWKLWLNWKINYSDTLDFSYPVYTSVWWNKSDRYMEIKYKKEVTQNPDCSIDTNLNILRSHYFSKFEEQRVSELIDKFPNKDKTKKDIINIQWKWENKSYVRVLLPKEAKVKQGNWLKVSEYKGYKVAEFYINTRLLETTYFNIEYSLENKACKNYDYKLYKQPWISHYQIEIKNNDKLTKNSEVVSDYYYK